MGDRAFMPCMDKSMVRFLFESVGDYKFVHQLGAEVSSLVGGTVLKKLFLFIDIGLKTSRNILLCSKWDNFPSFSLTNRELLQGAHEFSEIRLCKAALCVILCNFTPRWGTIFCDSKIFFSQI